MRDDIRRSIDLYASDGVPTGGFLRAVLEHRDVWDVMNRADAENARDLREILIYIHNEMPGNCHGSPDIVFAWIDYHRERRERQRLDEEVPPAVAADVAREVLADLVCPGCKQEIDPDTCGCGAARVGHGDPMDEGHAFVPLGCDCARVRGPAQGVTREERESLSEGVEG